MWTGQIFTDLSNYYQIGMLCRHNLEQAVQFCHDWLNGQFQKVQTGDDWSNMVLIGPNLFKYVQMGFKWIKIGPDWNTWV